jgi:ubiquinone/menaquinone biosynthesis C-methylase UbiE
MDYEIKRVYQNTDTAEHYDAQFRSSPRARLTAWGEKQAFLRVLRHVPDARATSGKQVLDIACGTGRFTELLLTAGYTVTGTDVSAKMLTIAQRRLGQASNLAGLQEGDAEHLPFNAQQFDGIACIRLYQRVPSAPRTKMLKEVKRVGRGWAVLFFAMSTPWLDLRRKLRSRLLPHHPTISHPISFDALHRELEEVGLTVRRTAWVLPLLSDGLVVLVTW